MSDSEQPRRTLLDVLVDALSGKLPDEERERIAEALKDPNSPESKALAGIRKLATTATPDAVAEHQKWKDLLGVRKLKTDEGRKDGERDK